MRTHHPQVVPQRSGSPSRKGRKASTFETLYSGSLPAGRGGHLYRAFPYPTKIAPEAIALFIAAHTRSGDTVFDGFAGSGTTGLAALLCGDPPVEVRAAAAQRGLRVAWGSRNAILYELGALGAFVAATLTNPPPVADFRNAAKELLDAADREVGWMYAARDDSGREGAIRHIVWSERLRCPRCHALASLWDGAVSRAPARIAAQWTCPHCAYSPPADAVVRQVETTPDNLLGDVCETRVRKPAWLYGRTGRANWSRRANATDLDLLEEIQRMPLPDCVPVVEIPWGDLYRRGYHHGITHLHHLYTRRNLIVLATLWQHTASFSETVRDALRFWLLSYNAAHATIMARIVAKSNQNELVVTSAQPGVLYVSGLPVEKNLLAGLRRKLTTITNAFAAIHGREGRVDVRQQSSGHVALPDHSIDYVFTDPPFGGNIPYAEVNFINEAWLGRYTQRTDEAVISPSQNKGVADYQRLLTQSLTEMRRILKPGGKMTLAFHSSSTQVWRALQQAHTDAGFDVQCAGVLGKTQGSFKQVTANTPRGDAMLLLRRCADSCQPANPGLAANPWQVAERLCQDALTLPAAERSAQMLYSRLVNHFLVRHQQVPVSAASFYEWLAAHTARANGE